MSFEVPSEMPAEPTRVATVPRSLPAAALPLLLLLWLLPLAGCGKKGPPEPPLRFVPAPGQDLMVSQQGRELVFEMTYPRETVAGLPLPPVRRVELWALSRAVSPVQTEGAGAQGAAEEPQAEAPQAETPQAEVPPVPEPVEPRQILTTGETAQVLEGRDLSEATVGGRLLFRVPLPTPEPTTAWFFALRTVVSEQDVSELSNQAVIVPLDPPEPPADLGLEAGEDGIRVSWRPPEDPALAPLGFNVYRRDPRNRFWGEPLRSVGAESDDFLDAGAVLGQAYIYTVTTVVSRQPLIESAPGGAREIDYRDVFPPAPPTEVVALGEEGRVRVVWEASLAADVAGYHVHRRRPGGAWERLTEVPVTALEHLDRGLPAGEVFLYRVSALDEAGNEGEASPEARAEVR